MSTSIRHLLAVAAIVLISTPASISTSAAKSVKAAASQPSARFNTFVQKLHTEGEDNFIRPHVAPFLALTPNAPSKAFTVDTLARSGDRQPEKLCKLVLEAATATDKPTPTCLVVTDGFIGADTSVTNHYKVGLDGKLLAAIRLTGKMSDGKPVRGSGVKTDLDINSPEVQSSFKKELDFWLSGKYKKYWKPKPSVKTAQN